jgi:HrpA-like RNA helicase
MPTFSVESTAAAPASSQTLVAVELDRQTRERRMLLATHLTLEEIEAELANGIEQEDVIEWNAEVTRDLAGFWRTTYFDVRKDLWRRYPRHHWPDDPLQAERTSRAKRRG